MGCRAVPRSGRRTAQHSHPTSRPPSRLHGAAASSLCPGRERVSQVGMGFWAVIPRRHFAILLPAEGHLGCRVPWDRGPGSCTGTECWPRKLRFVTKGGVEVAGTKENEQCSKDKGNEILRGYSQEQLKSAACWRWSSPGRGTGLLGASLPSRRRLRAPGCGQQQDWTSAVERKFRTRQLRGCHLGGLLKQDKA